MQMNRVNLVPLARRQAAARRRRARVWICVCCCYAVVLLAGYGLSVAALSVDGDEAAAALEKSTRQIDDLNHASSTLRPQLNETQQRLIVARTVGDQPDWSLLLSMISSVVDDDIVLTALKMEPTAAPSTQPAGPANNRSDHAPQQPAYVALNLQGMARSQASATQFVLRLERLGLFERVDLINSSRQTFGTTEANAFHVQCLLRRAGKSPSTPTANPPGGKQ